MGTAPPLEYLVTSSQAALETFELSRLNKSANLRKELRDVVEEWIEAEIQSRLARWILECRRTQDAASDMGLSELSAPLPVRARAEKRLPLFDDPQNLKEFQSEPASVNPFPSRAACDRPDSPPAPPVVDALPLRSTQRSGRATHALNFLQRQMRPQTDAIAPGVYKSPAETARNGASPGSVQNTPQHRRLHKSSQIASLFPAALECSDRSERACAQNRPFAAGNSAKAYAPKGRAVVDSAGSIDVAHVVPLARREKLRPSAPVRASMRFSAPQRKAV
jgi:hypothetical protein